MIYKCLRGSATLRYFFLLLNLEAWNLACVCKIENKLHFVPVKFLIFGLEIGLGPKNIFGVGLLAQRSSP